MTSKPLAVTVIAGVISLTSAQTPHAQTLTASQLAERTIERRAIEAANWGMPVVNFDRMVQAMLGKPNRQAGQGHDRPEVTANRQPSDR